MLKAEQPWTILKDVDDPHASSAWNVVQLAALIAELSELRRGQIDSERRLQSAIARVPAERRGSARNLAHYLALRRRDNRRLQDALASLGLSSLGRSEGHAMWTVDVLLKHLHHLIQHRWQRPPEAEDVVSRADARRLLERRSRALLGPKPSGRSTRIMVTLGAEAAESPTLVRELLEKGANALRLNCAHDTPEVWERILGHIREARRETHRDVLILMDLGGPKIRTGPLAAGPQVLELKPSRDAYGRPLAPAKVWLTPKDAPDAPPEPAPVLPLSAGWIDGLRPGESVNFEDARGARRSLLITEGRGRSRWAISSRTAYLRPDLILTREDGAGEAIGHLPGAPLPLTLRKGDRLLLTRSQDAGGPGDPARISCTLPEALDFVQPGATVRFDDGKLGGRVVECVSEGLLVEIQDAKAGGSRLAADKGINFPDSELGLPSLTPKDVVDLAFIARNADLVGCSFVRGPEDVRVIRRKLVELGGEKVGLLLKIETRTAFLNLPKLLLEALEAPAAGVMIARGDLAVECGYERLAELQEEILWLCEAAHLPVVWATQVLEGLAKTGRPSRAEITDAAMSERAECVMLNKGPYIGEAVSALDDILRRMEAHQNKKTALLRPLNVAMKT